jgi:chaperonin cofactor prefoldin
MSDQDIIDFEARKSTAPPRFRVEGRIKAAPCAHSSVLVDQGQRMLVCKECGATVDALEWMLRLAVQKERLDTQFDSVRRQLEEAMAEAQRLRQEIGRLIAEKCALETDLEFSVGPSDVPQQARARAVLS